VLSSFRWPSRSWQARTLTYEKMTDDQAALLDHLKTGPVDVVGWSDGGIEALLLGVRHPTR
jgi:pimeloyl-ACP methyl ester carboxylesterase